MIVTFYSYKGGVGRSMAMANVAFILARQGLKTLIVDFDLEAPGLEQYFQTNHAAARRNPGLVDLLQAYKRSMSVTGPATGGDAEFTQIDRFIVPLYESLPGGGRLDLLPAGRRESREELDRYAATLRTFDWQDFYFNWEGELFFEWLRGLFVPDRYDVVLVDSRTGVTEMGGICTYQLADAVVMLCAANHQNMRGTRNVITDFLSPSVRATRQFRPLQILVVPARIEQRDPALYDAFMTRFDAEFQDILPDALHGQMGYRDLTVPYEPTYAFDERVITDPSASGQQRTIAGAFVRLARAIALLAPADAMLRARGAPDAAPVPPAAASSARGRETPGAQESESQATGSQHAGSRGPGSQGPDTLPPGTLSPGMLPPVQYDVAKRFAGYDLFLAYNHTDADTVEALVRGLRDRGLELFVDRHELASGEDWRARTEQALFHSRLCVVAYGRDGFGAMQTRQILDAVSSVRSAHELPMLVVSLPGADDGRYWIEAPRELTAGARSIDLRQWTTADTRQLDRLAQVLQQAPGTIAPPVPAAAQATAPLEGSGHVDPPPPPFIVPEATTATTTAASYEAPYPGARPFTERDAGFLFSRETETVQVADALERQSLVIITGPSACGKTSLILAAVVPALRQRQAARGGPGWLFERTTPSADPLPDLDRAVERLRAARAAAHDTVRCVLFADELEDLLLHPNEEDRRRYLQRLGELASSGAGGSAGGGAGGGAGQDAGAASGGEPGSGPGPGPGADITVLIAVREDRVPSLQRQAADASVKVSGVVPVAAAAAPRSVPPSAPPSAPPSGPPSALSVALPFSGAHLMALPRLSSDALSDAIERTAQRAGLAFEPGLVRRLVVDWGLDQRFLPFLQSVLYALWARRREGYLTNRAYDDIADPVEAAAEAAYAALSPSQQPLAAGIVSRLLALCGDMATYDASCARSDLLPRDMDPREFELVVERLIEGHLIYAFAGPDGAPRVAPAFSSEQWTRASQWMEDDRELLDWLVRVDRYRQDWERASRDDDALLTGSAHADAEAWAAKRGADLTAAEHEYLRRSNEAASLKRKVRWFYVAAVVAILCWVGWSWYQGERQQTQAVAQAAQASARATAVEQLVNAGDAAAGSGAWKEALSSYSQAIDVAPDNVSARLKRGAIRDQQRDYTGAVEDFTAAIDISTKTAGSTASLVQAHLARGTTWFHQGDAQRALADLNAALTLDPVNPLALFNRAVVQEALKNDQAALRDYTAALAADADFADALFNRGALYERLSRDPAALGDRRKEAAADFTSVLRVKDAAPQTQQAARTRLEGLGYAVSAVQRGPTRIQLLHQNAKDREVVGRIGAALRDKGYIVDGVYAVTGTGSDVRYFFLEDENVATAVQQVAEAALAAAGYNVQLPTSYVRSVPGMDKVTPGRIEVWIPPLELRLLPSKNYPSLRGARSD